MTIQPSTFAGLNLGAPAAERDAGLMQYFVESEAFCALEAGRAQILIGNRGSGKSAILRYLAETQKRLGAHVVEILPENYSYEMLKDLLAREIDGNWAKQSAYLVAWRYVIYILAMKQLADAHFGASNSKRRLHAFLRDRFHGHQTTPVDVLISYMKRLEGLKLGSFSPMRVKELNQLYKLEGNPTCRTIFI